jgi:hypothetical protein
MKKNITHLPNPPRPPPLPPPGDLPPNPPTRPLPRPLIILVLGYYSNRLINKEVTWCLLCAKAYLRGWLLFFSFGNKKIWLAGEHDDTKLDGTQTRLRA